jgi:hypothetical protein
LVCGHPLASAGYSEIPEHPVRRRSHGIETFNVLRGGEYLFMPSLSALTWIGQGEW